MSFFEAYEKSPLLIIIIIIIIIKNRNRGATGSSPRSGIKHQKLPESNLWPESGKQMSNVLTT